MIWSIWMNSKMEDLYSVSNLHHDEASVEDVDDRQWRLFFDKIMQNHRSDAKQYLIMFVHQKIRAFHVRCNYWTLFGSSVWIGQSRFPNIGSSFHATAWLDSFQQQTTRNINIKHKLISFDSSRCSSTTSFATISLWISPIAHQQNQN